MCVCVCVDDVVKLRVEPCVCVCVYEAVYNQWTGLVDWTGGLIAKRSGSHSVVSRSPARVCDIDTHSDPAKVGGANSP